MTANLTPFHHVQLIMNPNARFHLVQFFTTLLTWLLFSISRAVSHDTNDAILICLLVGLCVVGVIGLINKFDDVGISVLTVMWASLFVIGGTAGAGAVMVIPVIMLCALDELTPSNLSKGRVVFSVLIQFSITVYLMLH